MESVGLSSKPDGEEIVVGPPWRLTQHRPIFFFLACTHSSFSSSRLVCVDSFLLHTLIHQISFHLRRPRSHTEPPSPFAVFTFTSSLNVYTRTSGTMGNRSSSCCGTYGRGAICFIPADEGNRN